MICSNEPCQAPATRVFFCGDAITHLCRTCGNAFELGQGNPDTQLLDIDNDKDSEDGAIYISSVGHLAFNDAGATPEGDTFHMVWFLDDVWVAVDADAYEVNGEVNREALYETGDAIDPSAADFKAAHEAYFEQKRPVSQGELKRTADLIDAFKEVNNAD